MIMPGGMQRTSVGPLPPVRPGAQQRGRGDGEHREHGGVEQDHDGGRALHRLVRLRVAREVLALGAGRPILLTADLCSHTSTFGVRFFRLVFFRATDTESALHGRFDSDLNSAFVALYHLLKSNA